MKTIQKITQLLSVIMLTILIGSCSQENHDHEHEGHDHEAEIEDNHGHEGHVEQVHLSEQQFNSLDMKIDSISIRNIGSFIDVNGQLEVPPQNEAAVTAIVGANVKSIQVIEGDKVSKGQVLAYLSHPNLIRIQTDYVSNYNQLEFLRLEYNRQKKLHDENVGSAKEFQRIEADYKSKQGLVKGDEAQLRMMGLNLNSIRSGKIFENVPIKSPISGHIRMVDIKIGQYVRPETEMFEIVNISHVHADLMVFEKDMHKVNKGQKVRFSTLSVPGKELEAEIYSVGKAFEQNPKAIHLHAEIENKEGLLIPGMFVKGQIAIDDIKVLALPEDAVVREGDRFYIFSVKLDESHNAKEWQFTPIEVTTGQTEAGWTEIRPLKTLDSNLVFAYKNAFYILSELKKGEAEHSH